MLAQTVFPKSSGVHSGPLAEGPIGVRHWVVTHADFQAFVVQSKALSLTGFPANVHRYYGAAKLRTYFTGGGITSCVFELGDANDPNGLVLSTNCFGVTALDTVLWGWTAAEAGGGPEAAYAPELLLTVNAGGTVDLLTAGEIELWVAFQLPANIGIR